MNKLILIPLFCCFLAIAQNPYNTRYNLEEGLPTSNIYSSFEDYQGYLWFGTDVGVLKYDGYEFVHYNTDHGLGDNEVFKTFEDSNKRLWFLSLNGQLSYFKNNIFVNAQNNIFLKKASYQKMLIDVFEDDAGNLNFLYVDGKILTINNELTDYRSIDLNVATYSIWKDNDKFQALTRSSVIDINTEKESVFQEKIMSLKGYRYYHDNNNYYFSSKGSVYEFINKSFVKIIELPDADIIFMTKIDADFWIGTRKGLFTIKKGQTTRYFRNDAISSILKDSESNIWVTTLNNGIKLIPHIDVIVHDFNQQNLKISTIKKGASNELWVGSEKGLYKMYSDNSFQKLKVSDGSQKMKRIRSFNDTIVAIGDNSIDVFDNSRQRMFSFGANDISKYGADYIVASSVVFKFSATKLSLINDDFKNISSKKLVKYKIFGKRTNVMERDLNDNILLGTSTGLFTYDGNNVQKNNSENGELNTSILDLFLDRESNRLLVASNSKGVITLKNNDVESHITSLQGLNSNGCNAIEKIDTDTYFIGTNTGLNKVEFKNETVTILNYSSVLKNTNERVNDIEVIDSLIYLATDRGLISFNYNIKPTKEVSPRLIIESVNVNGNPVQDLSNLSYDKNDITIHFTGISFADFGNLTYEYKFSNDKSWSTTTNRQLNFKNLANGSYSLQIRSKGTSNLYSTVTNIDFIIKPPFWRTQPFVLFTSGLFLLILTLSIKKRIKIIQSRFETERKAFKSEQDKMTIEKQMIEFEQKAMRLQMNPHFIFNALNTIKGYYSGGNIKEANHYISKFSKLLRLILENDGHLITLSKEIEILELYIKLIQLRYENVFEYDISISDKILVEELGIPPLLLQPIVENAIIHGLAPSNSKGILQINFSTENDKLVCKVTDNGVGFKVSDKNKGLHQSKALTITRERVHLLNDSKSQENFQIKNLQNPSGTAIIIKLALHNLWN